MAEQKKDILCPLHRAEGAMREVATAWRAKARTLEPQAAGALADSLRSLQRVLDRRIHAIEEKEKAGDT